MHLRIRTIIPAAGFVVSASLSAQTTGLCAGHWSGSISLPGAPLAFDVDLSVGTDGRCAGDISIPQQKTVDVALVDLRVNADSIRFTIAGVAGTPTFYGVRAADGRTIAGRFTQATATLPFSMSLGAAPADAARLALTGFDAWVDSAIVAWKVVGLSIGITVDGQTVYLKGHGLRDAEKKLPVTPQTLFAIGSSSKAFTTFAMGALVDQGKLEWDLPVRTYLPWFRMNNDFATLHITPRDLVTHRSGLPRHDALWYNNSTMTREDLVRRIAFLPLNKDLRETFQYNNLMFLTAGYLVGSINGTSWEDGLRQLVLTPLGMTRTNFSVRESQADADFSQPYRVRHDSIQKTPFRDITLIGPAGAINSSAEEMLKWVGLHLAGGKRGDTQVIQATTLRDMYRPYTPITGLGDYPELGPMSYGLGWFVDTYRGHYRAQHGGNIDGFTASVTLLPQDRIGLVVLDNQNGSPLPEIVARHAMDRLFAGTRRDWSAEFLARQKAGAVAALVSEQKKGVARVANARPAHALAEYAGVYSDSGYGPLTIELQRDTLAMIYNGIRTRLQPWHYETFSALRNPADPTFEDAKLTFRTNASGRVDAALISLESAAPASTFLRQPDAQLRDAAFIARFTGRYQLPGGPIAVVSQRGGTLYWAQGSGAPSELLPENGSRFVLKAQPTISFEFNVDATGKSTGARVVQPGAVTDIVRLP